MKKITLVKKYNDDFVKKYEYLEGAIVKYLDHQCQESEGIIMEVKYFGFKIQDLATEIISYCDINQIELL